MPPPRPALDAALAAAPGGEECNVMAPCVGPHLQPAQPVAVVCCFSWPSRGEESQERYIPTLHRTGKGLGMAWWCLMAWSVVGRMASYIILWMI